MRFYCKLFVLIAIFIGASRWQLRRTISDLAYDARVAFVCAFGSASDYQTLIDDTQQMLAREQGNLDLYLKGKHYRQLLAERLAAAARLNISLSDDDLVRMRTECAIEAFGPQGISISLGRDADESGEFNWEEAFPRDLRRDCACQAETEWSHGDLNPT